MHMGKETDKKQKGIRKKLRVLTILHQPKSNNKVERHIISNSLFFHIQSFALTKKDISLNLYKK